MSSAVERILNSTAPEQNTEEWLQWRKSRLTASDAARICGNAIATWKTLLMQKAGLQASSFQGNKYTEAGHVNEPLAAAAYAARTGRTLHYSLRPVEHELHCCLAASLDAVTACGVNVEIKCFSTAVKPHSKPKTMHHNQAQFQMACTGLLKTDLVYYYPHLLDSSGQPQMDIHPVAWDPAWFTLKLPKFLQFVSELHALCDRSAADVHFSNSDADDEGLSWLQWLQCFSDHHEGGCDDCEDDDDLQWLLHWACECVHG